MSNAHIVRGATVAGTNDGSFAPQHKREGDTAVLPVPLSAHDVPLEHVHPGDTCWLDHEVFTVAQTNLFAMTVTDTEGRTRQALNGQVGRFSRPLAPFDDVDWEEREDLDSYDRDFPFHGALVRYNADGIGQVSAFVGGGGTFDWHGRYFFGTFEPDELLPDGRTKGEAYKQWMDEVGGTAIVNGIIKTYGWDIFGYDGVDTELQPAICATNIGPGELSDEQIVTMIWDASVRWRNESDPGTFNCPYHGRRWLQKAADEHPLPWVEEKPPF